MSEFLTQWQEAAELTRGADKRHCFNSWFCLDPL